MARGYLLCDGAKCRCSTVRRIGGEEGGIWLCFHNRRSGKPKDTIAFVRHSRRARGESDFPQQSLSKISVSWEYGKIPSAGFGAQSRWRLAVRVTFEMTANQNVLGERKSVTLQMTTRRRYRLLRGNKSQGEAMGTVA